MNKTFGSFQTEYIRDPDGSLLATYVNGSYFGNFQDMWIGGKHFGEVMFASGNASQTENFAVTNWLGSQAAYTSPATGVPTAAYLSLPFGDAQTNLFGSNNDDIHFTGKERDGESGNDYFDARYYSSSMGRFMLPDWSAKEEPVPYATMDDPQSLNLYSYVRNNPLSRTDPDGHCDSNGQNCSAGDHIAGAIGGALNIIPATLNLPNQAFNAISGAFNGPQIDLIPMIQADAHASQGGIDVGTAAATAVPVAAVAAEVTTAGMVVGEVRAATAAEAVPESIPAGPGARPSPTQQGAINEMGDAHGCSTCGTTSPGTKTGNWVGDHQPPTKQHPTGAPQVYKPRCLKCSQRQGTEISAANRAAKKTQTQQQ